MKVLILTDIDCGDFSFKCNEMYKAIDGNDLCIEELKGKILVRQPNSPKRKDWWCTISKELIGKKLVIVDEKL